MYEKLDISPAKSDIIKEKFDNTENIPNWMVKLKVQGFIGKYLYSILLFLR